MKSLKIILSLVALIFATQAMNAQRTLKGQTETKPERVKEMQVNKRTDKQMAKYQKANRKMERRADRPAKRRAISKAKVDKTKAKHGKIKADKNTPLKMREAKAKQKRKGSKAQKNKHKKHLRTADIKE